MRSLLLLAALACALAISVSHGGTTALPHSSGDQVVASVYDGDTLTLRDGRRVRLLQIDTPELGSGECFSRAARAALVRLVPVGTRVGLEFDGGLDRVDRYSRLLRYIRRSGENVNLELVGEGAAAPYFYRGARGRYASALLAAATQAKAAKRGLWKACPSTLLDPTRAVATGLSGPRSTAPPASGKCDPNYTGGCVPPYPPDLDCADIRALGIAPVRVVGADPHGLDGDGDGWGCE
jgi:endonuclease YncB( thermonuclease family)